MQPSAAIEDRVSLVLPPYVYPTRLGGIWVPKRPLSWDAMSPFPMEGRCLPEPGWEFESSIPAPHFLPLPSTGGVERG